MPFPLGPLLTFLTADVIGWFLRRKLWRRMGVVPRSGRERARHERAEVAARPCRRLRLRQGGAIASQPSLCETRILRWMERDSNSRSALARKVASCGGEGARGRSRWSRMASPFRVAAYRLDAPQRRGPRGNADPGRTQKNDNIERVKSPKALIEDLDFVNRLERFGQAADRAPPLRNQKFADSPLEGGVSCELVSEVKFASRAPMGRFHGDWERFLVP